MRRTKISVFVMAAFLLIAACKADSSTPKDEASQIIDHFVEAMVAGDVAAMQRSAALPTVYAEDYYEDVYDEKSRKTLYKLGSIKVRQISTAKEQAAVFTEVGEVAELLAEKEELKGRERDKFVNQIKKRMKLSKDYYIRVFLSEPGDIDHYVGFGVAKGSNKVNVLYRN